MKFSLTQGDGQTKLEDAVNVFYSNGTANTIFKYIQVYIGDQMVETNPYFNYRSFIKMITTLSPVKLKSLGGVGNVFQDDITGGGLVDTFDGAHFNSLGNESKKKLKSIKENGLHLTFPIMADIASCDQYLCDDIQ